MIFCACGCGTKIPAFDAKGRPRRYTRGHHSRNGILYGVDNFWQNVNRSSPSGCWVWLGAQTSNGYGSLQISGVKYSAHRLSYELNFGSIPEGVNVLHSCDNKACVNPAHLFLGTQTDNMHDAIAKGRVDGMPLSDQDVLDIRERHVLGETINSLAKEYGSCEAYLWKIVRFEKRRHVNG